MKKQPEKNSRELSRSRVLVYRVISISIPFILLFILELLLRLSGYGEKFNLFVDFPGEEPAKYRIVNRDIGNKYFSKLAPTTPTHDRFLKEKPENGFRVFVLGSSTVVGFPYDENIMFSRILQQRLQDSYPDKQVEVINTAITAVNSFTLLDNMNDVLREKPDAILIYAGHNEFYGAYGIGSVAKTRASRVIALVDLKLLSLRFYQLIQNTFGNLGNNLLRGGGSAGASATLMKIMAEKQNIEYNSKIYRIGMDNFTKNMDRILEKAERKNVPVLISELICNVKDIPPLDYTGGAGDSSAIRAFREAIQYEQTGKYEQAKASYYRAKDLDCTRFRASEEVNEVIRQLADKHHACLVPMQAAFFEQASTHELIGNNLITEHVHPNIKGYFLMADAFFYTLAELKLPGEKLNMIYYKSPLYYLNNYGYTELDSLLGVHRVNSLKQFWPFQPADRHTTLYRETYSPGSRVDSLAFEAFRKEEYSSDVAHAEMASFYLGQGEYYKASREYLASIRCNPYALENYIRAADCLIKNNDHPTAIKVLEQSLAVEETNFAHLRIGEIELYRGNYKAAIRALEMAAKLDTRGKYRLEILKKLQEAYHYHGNPEKAEQLYQRILETDPQFNPVYPDRDFSRIHTLVPVQVEKQINKALKLYGEDSIEAALEILLASLEVKETPIANCLIGDILLQKGERESIVYYIKAYDDYRQDVQFLFNLGILYAGYKQLSSAEQILDDLKWIDPQDRRVAELEKIIAQLNQDPSTRQ